MEGGREVDCEEGSGRAAYDEVQDVSRCVGRVCTSEGYVTLERDSTREDAGRYSTAWGSGEVLTVAVDKGDIALWGGYNEQREKDNRVL